MGISNSNLLVLPLITTLLLGSCSRINNSEPWIISSPAGSRYTIIEKSGETIIPNGRIVSPIGNSIVVAPHPYGLTLSPDGNTAVTANSGTKPLSITIIRDIFSDNPEVQQVPPGHSTDNGVLASVFMGLAISKDNKTV